MAEEFDPSTKINKRVIGEYTSRTEKGRKANKDNDARWARVDNANFSNPTETADNNQFSKMKKSMDQVTPGKWKSKDKIDGKMP